MKTITMDLKFSIIIPYCNTNINQTKFCLESLICQDLNLLKEIIVVNDGSDYEHEKQIKRLVEELNSIILTTHKYVENTLIKIINQSNNFGPANARKIGYNSSIGDVILFVDSDDWICDTKWIFKLNKYFKDKRNIEIIAFDYIEVNNTQYININKVNKHSNETILTPDYLLKNHTSKIISTWRYAFRRNILKFEFIWYSLNLPHEDFYFMGCLSTMNIPILETNDVFYCYRVNNLESITTNLKKNNLRQIIEILSKWYVTNPEFNIYTSNSAKLFWVYLYIEKTVWNFGFRKVINFAKKNNLIVPTFKDINLFYKQYKNCLIKKIFWKKIYLGFCKNILIFDFVLPKMLNFFLKKKYK
ncbi:glycosyltransferase family 2 protein [Mycoplasmoides pirum]|uniref:glycosyltransferase family 2 protein n=2 Tax=Mycoplasmoides pirum TaxID=2122 RepID=UPI00192E6A36|nr:glycosyltransferase family 2 protein [Mycoplasmoides pirum]